MPVTNVIKDIDNLTLTFEASFAAPVARVWEVYADPRQLEQVWGPPSHPATFEAHDLSVGGKMHYFMTGPEGEKYPGYWHVTAVDEGVSFSFNDGFCDENYVANPDMPESKNHYRFEATDDGTKATFTSVYTDAASLQQVLDMGMEEGATQSINQIDTFLAA